MSWIISLLWKQALSSVAYENSDFTGVYMWIDDFSRIQMYLFLQSLAWDSPVSWIRCPPRNRRGSREQARRGDYFTQRCFQILAWIGSSIPNQCLGHELNYLFCIITSFFFSFFFLLFQFSFLFSFTAKEKGGEASLVEGQAMFYCKGYVRGLCIWEGWIFFFFFHLNFFNSGPKFSCI